MPKRDRILDAFPAVYGAATPGKLLGEVVRRLAAPLEEIDTHLFRIQRAHRLAVAEHALDIVRLAAVLGLTRFHFEDLLDDRELDDERRLARLRRRVERAAQVHLQGLGAPSAVLEGAAIFLDAAVASIHHLDPERYSHVAGVRFDDDRRSRVYLHENPLRRRTVDAAERYPMGRWTVDNRNVERALTTLVMEGLGDRTVLPTIFCPATGESVRFEGLVPDGAALVLSPTHGATLAGHRVDDWISTARGGHCDFSAWDDARWVVESPAARTQFDGDLEHMAVPAAQARKPTPSAPPGVSEWVFMVAEGAFDTSEADFAVFATPREPIGVWDGDPSFDASVYDFPASARTSMTWNERVPCAFKLLLPAAVPASRADGSVQWRAPDVGRLASVISRFRAAGVRAFVDTAPDAWILGDGIIRAASAADGEGVTVNTTSVRDGDSELFVSFGAVREVTDHG